jgi:hypothetical protein
MARFFVDTLAHVTQARIDYLLANAGKPEVWFRYLGEVTPDEVILLNAAGIQTGFVCRRSNRVSGSFADGRNDAAEDHMQLVELLRKQPTAAYFPIVFLDVEAPFGQPNLSPEYYRGFASIWSGAGDFGPGCYLPAVSGPISWAALENAVSHGARCLGAWVAEYKFQSQADLQTGASRYHDTPWGPDTPHRKTVNVVAWQFKGNCDGFVKKTGEDGFKDGTRFDYNVFAPRFDASIMR